MTSVNNTKRKMIARGKMAKIMSERTGFPIFYMNQILRELYSTFAELISSDYQISIKGVGSLVKREYPSSRGINPQTKESMIIPAQNRVKFTLSRSFKKALNQ